MPSAYTVTPYVTDERATLVGVLFPGVGLFDWLLGGPDLPFVPLLLVPMVANRLVRTRDL